MDAKKTFLGSEKWVMTHFASLFNQFADPNIVLDPQDSISYQIASASYESEDKRPAVIDGYQLEHLGSDETKACVYVSHEKKHVIIGYRGTDAANISDLQSDVEILLGVSGLDQRVEISLQIYDLARRKYPEYTKWITGHSLGGTIAYIVAKHREPDRCTVFNPGSSVNSLFIQMLTDTVSKAPWTTHVMTYKILGDIISSFSFIGATKVFRVTSMNPLNIHALVNFQPTPPATPLSAMGH